MDQVNWSQTEIDSLKEIVNIGAGNAATSLAELLNQRVGMSVPQALIGPLAEVQMTMGRKDEKVLAVFLKIHGEVSGALTAIFPPSSAISLAGQMTHQPKESLEKFEQADLSALQEMGNIMLGTAIAAFGRLLGLKIMHTIPDVAIDRLGAVTDSVVLEIGQAEGRVLSFKVTLSVNSSPLSGDLYFLFDAKASAALLNAARKLLPAP